MIIPNNFPLREKILNCHLKNEAAYNTTISMVFAMRGFKEPSPYWKNITCPKKYKMNIICQIVKKNSSRILDPKNRTGKKNKLPIIIFLTLIFPSNPI